jgi:hypothetical protein
MIPPSPSSQGSHISRASSVLSHEKYPKSILRRFFGWIFWPLKYLFSVSLSLHNSSRNSTRWTGSLLTSPSSRGSFSHMYGLASKRMNSFKDHVVHRTTDRRRGVVEVVLL